MTFVLSLIYFTHRSRTKKLLAPLAGELTDPQHSWLGVANGSWRGHAVRMTTGRSGKSGPDYVVVDISASMPSRLTVWTRTWFPNIRLFVPPPVEVPNFPDHIIRGENAEFTHRLFDELGPLIQSTITRRDDLLEITPNRVRVRRTIESALGDTNDGAREAWNLATRIVEYVG